MTSQARATRSIIAGPAIPGLSGVALLARVRSLDSAALVTRASVSSIAYTVSNLTAGTSLGSGTFATTTVYDSLQQSDPRWQVDDASSPGADGAWGYNWAGTLASTLFPVTVLDATGLLAGPASAYLAQCSVAFAPVSGQPWRIVFQWRVTPVYG